MDSIPTFGELEIMDRIADDHAEWIANNLDELEAAYTRLPLPPRVPSGVWDPASPTVRPPPPSMSKAS